MLFRSALITHLIKTRDWRQVLVFCKTKHGANRLAEQLTEEGLEADAIHGNKSQNARARALERFKAGESRALIVTDVAARGLELDASPYLVNFDLPYTADDYLHRIDRVTSTGEVVILLCGEERDLLAAVETHIKRTIERHIAEGFEPSPEWETARYEQETQKSKGRGPKQSRNPQKNADAPEANEPGLESGESAADDNAGPEGTARQNDQNRQRERYWPRQHG